MGVYAWLARAHAAGAAHPTGRPAALTWFPERRARLEQPLLRHYHAQLGVNGVQRYSWDDCWYDYRLWVLCALFIPAGQRAMQLPTDQWWNHLERIMLAVQDLDCLALVA